MGCRPNKTDNCVADIVRAINDAQENVEDQFCDVSCERSIQDLLGPVAANNLDTVPFILYCEGDCQPFKGYGVDINRIGTPTFNCVESFIFRVNEIDDDNCATLELLTFNETAETTTTFPGQPGEADELTDPCDQVANQQVAALTGTGICITVNLDCFCAITCLPAVDIF